MDATIIVEKDDRGYLASIVVGGSEFEKARRDSLGAIAAWVFRTCVEHGIDEASLWLELD